MKRTRIYSSILFLCFVCSQSNIMAQCSSGQCSMCDIVATMSNASGVTIDQGTSNGPGVISAGSTAVGSSLEVTATDCGEISFEVDVAFTWDQGTSTSWIHGISFQNSAGWSAAIGIPPNDAGWLFINGGVTGICSGNSYGTGYYYDPPGTDSPPDSGDPIDQSNFSSWDGMMCSMTGAESGEDTNYGPLGGADISLGGEINDGDPSDNWGVNCTDDCPTFGFELTYCPSSAGTTTESITFQITEDGESGGWGSNAGCNYNIEIPIIINNAGVALDPMYTVECGDCIDLTAGSNCSSYTWFNDDTNTQIASGNSNQASTIQVCPTENTNYSVNVSGSCGALSATTLVEVVNCVGCESEAGSIIINKGN